ncbi:hypothetical protein RCO28_34605 [Streptomyces sp. LHD-70]|uniref:hypothetical protein n=1 Tax=Streptomyces sp. LHD-70 TaxID=3072140 RepID=UPI00280CA0DE|nr:hypothetical protein [Streptomyces sp. LHD-70]MDQ8707565.1 hypothetical protein [Streptomyces sp. LHD-70]
MAGHIFVDETKARGYVIAAAAVLPRNLNASRTALRGLLLGGQSRIHFTKERDSRRRTILSRMSELDVSVDVYDASALASAREARAACLDAIVSDAVGCP